MASSHQGSASSPGDPVQRTRGAGGEPGHLCEHRCAHGSGWRWPVCLKSVCPCQDHSAGTQTAAALTVQAQQGEVSRKALRAGLSLKESLAMKGRLRSLLCCHHTARSLAADQISLLRECESKWHVIWMLMKILSCCRLQSPSRKLSSGRRYLLSHPLSLPHFGLHFQVYIQCKNNLFLTSSAWTTDVSWII